MNKALLYTALLAFLASPAFSEELPSQAQSDALNNQTAPATENNTPPQQAMNCQYRIPADTTEIAPSLIKAWTEHAVTQAFSFSATGFNQELDALQPCFTEQGWKGFSDALKQSGNIDAIKTQKLTVSSQADGAITLSVVKENQWKVSLPVEVVYQNDTQKMTQHLSIDVLVGRKVSGDLGIMQMIAAPRAMNKTPNAPQSSADNMSQATPGNSPAPQE